MHRTALAFSVLVAAVLIGAAGLRAPPPSDTLEDIRAHLAPKLQDVRTTGLPSLGTFTENAGQVPDPDVLYYASSGELAIGLGVGAVQVRIRGAGDPGDLGFRVAFVGASDHPPQGLGEPQSRSLFFLGSDPSAWRTDVRSFSQVVYADLYPGIDLLYRGSPEGVKYDFHVAPGADPRAIEMRYEGVDSLALESGGVMARFGERSFHDSPPVAWQGSDPASCRFESRGPRAIGFACEGRDPNKALVIDPLISATYLGGRASDGGWGVAVDAEGTAYVCGLTGSPNFPTRGTVFGFSGGLSDAFVTKVSRHGEILWSTFFGGTARDTATACAVHETGVYIAGLTLSSNFPTSDGTFDRSYGGSSDVFVAKFSTDGILVFSVLLGGVESDIANGLAVDRDGNAIVTGRTQSPDFPFTPSPADSASPRQLIESTDAFVAKINADGSELLWAVHLTGERWDEGQSVAVDPAGDVYVAGYTSSVNFTTTEGALDETINGFEDAFVMKLTSSGSVVYSTFLGGIDGDVALAIAVDAEGNASLTGFTESPDFPTTAGSFQETLQGRSDTFVAKLNPEGSALVYSTLLGASGRDDGEGIAIDEAGSAYVTGLTTSPDFPTTPDAFDRVLGASEASVDDDGFVARLSPDGRDLVYSSYIGGVGQDLARDIAVDPWGDAFITGFTLATDFPTTSDGFDFLFNGNPDAYLVKVRPVPGNRSPSLASPTEADFTRTAVEPKNGSTSTPFTFSVLYADADGDPPLDGFPVVHVFLDGGEIAGSPFPMLPADPTDTNFADGVLYRTSVVLSERSPWYSHTFGVFDAEGHATPNWPSPAALGPGVAVEASPSAEGGFAAEVALFVLVAAAVPVVLLAIRRRMKGYRGRP